VSARPRELESYSLVLLRRGPNAAELPDEEADRLQEAHLAHLQEMRERGAMLAAGPFRAQEDESLRGLCLYVVGLEEARALAESDPSVRAGRMAVDVMTWLTPKGELALPRFRP
jgi:uncharacterized protein YciI